jgi:uncharacterized protein YndB with AHSA1/START domain
MSHETTLEASDREIRLAREFDAPRHLVWRAIVEPQHMAKWWGPRGFTTTVDEIDLKPGGLWKYTMHGPNNDHYPNQSVFLEIVPNERIAYTQAGHREGGPGTSFVATWTFESIGSQRTRVTMQALFPTAADRDFCIQEFGALEGGKQTLECLGEHLLTMTA